MTGYPSIDKPWLKYYSADAIQAASGQIPFPNKTVYQYAFENNQNGLKDIVFSYYGKNISYGTFFENVKRTARALAAIGIQKGDIVTIISMQTPETIALIYGLNYIGAVANMVYLTLSGKEIVDTIKRTNSKAVFVLDIALAKVKEVKNNISVPVIVLAVTESMPIMLKLASRLKAKPADHPFIAYLDFIKSGNGIGIQQNNDTNSVAVIVYTSGSTGQPKGVMLTNENINALIFQYRYTDIHFGRGETFLDVLPTFLGYGIGMMAVAVCNGLKTYLWLQPEAQKISEQFWNLRPNHIELGKAHVMQIMKDCPSNANLDFSINFAGGGESVSVSEEEEINAFLKDNGSHNRFIYGYGMTECASAVCTNSNSAYKVGSLGIPLPLCVMKVVDVDTRAELPFDEVGEICVSAPNVMAGYYNNAAATEEVIEIDENGNRWIHTGDLGRIDEDGFVFLQGRLKRIYLVKSEDSQVYKLFPQRVEETVKMHDMVASCSVIAVQDAVQYHRPVAFTVLKPNADRESVHREITQLFVQELPEHARPQEIFYIEDIPVTSSGKIDYAALEKTYEDMKKGEVSRWERKLVIPPSTSLG